MVARKYHWLSQFRPAQWLQWMGTCRQYTFVTSSLLEKLRYQWTIHSTSDWWHFFLGCTLIFTQTQFWGIWGGQRPRRAPIQLTKQSSSISYRTLHSSRWDMQGVRPLSFALLSNCLSSPQVRLVSKLCGRATWMVGILYNIRVLASFNCLLCLYCQQLDPKSMRASPMVPSKVWRLPERAEVGRDSMGRLVDNQQIALEQVRW